MIGAMVLVGLVVLGAVSRGGLAKPDEPSVFDQLDLLVDVRQELVTGYVEQPDEREMIERAVRAMVGSLGDQYTVYLSPEELSPFDKQVRGTFSGIGAEIDIFENRLRIVSPLEDSPAWQSGVMAGDVVLEIEGESTQDITIMAAVDRLTGPEGTEVTIKVRHPSGEEREITITRAVINVQTVRGLRRDGDNHWDYMLDPDHAVGYIRITQFTDSTVQNVGHALDLLLEQGMSGLILDVRFNPGGMLSAAIGVSDFFLASGQRIVSVKGRKVPEQVQMSSDETTIPDIPVVILANEASASASEIVTGALSDNERAQFIGTRTFGKGSVQQVRMLEGGHGALKITHAYYYLPNGRNIHRREGDEQWGVDPADGFYVPMDVEQVRKMIEVRRDSDILKPGSDGVPAQRTPEWIETALADVQLAAGLRAVLGRLETGEWPEVGGSGIDELVRQGTRHNLLRQKRLIHERLEVIEKELAKLDDPMTDDQDVVVGDDEVKGEGSAGDADGADDEGVDVEVVEEGSQGEPATVEQ